MMRIPADFIKREAQRALEEASIPREDTGLFCPISLGDWMLLCRKADVPHVPAELIATFLLEDCLYFDTPGEHQDRLRQTHQAIQAAKLPFHMARLDCCASIEIKYSLSKGEPSWKPEFGDIIIDDPRTFDILMEYPRPKVPVWRRPWVNQLIVAQYPVEYRAFVRDGQVAGISNYYPQRPLQSMEHVDEVKAQTEKLVQAVQAPLQWPISPMPDDLNPQGIHFTADFILTDDSLKFLEGGPPHELGAHPCCFRAYEIAGVALENRNNHDSQS